MAIRGRKPKPTRIKRLHGNPGRRPLNAAEATPEPAIPSPPEFLSDEAKLEWSRVSEQLFRLGLLSQLDRTSFAAYCQAYSRWKQAEAAIAELASYAIKHFPDATKHFGVERPEQLADLAAALLPKIEAERPTATTPVSKAVP